MNFPNQKYDIIVVDPPWKIKKLTHRARPNQIKMDYNTMSLNEISELPINGLTNGNSWCFLWTTQKYLFDAKNILEKWGFKYLLLMTWKKIAGRSEGMPLFGFRWNSEFILVGYQGKIPLWVKGKSLIKNCFEGVNIRHSQKPIEFYDMIKHLGNSRIDIFARDKKENWDVWGDDVCSQSSEEVRNSIRIPEDLPSGGKEDDCIGREWKPSDDEP